ncbi:hypothetical protein WA026_004277 [Henosepilachna vigintioctopunctata]|uniref:Uncharacterized protein n=1 Tax=Henosepilachna vigintioctopunctata TaxID=420089 RepID=A0AAW1V9K9_9CUCU
MKKQLLHQQKKQQYQRETYKSHNSSGVNVHLNNEQVIISNIPTNNRFGALNEVSEDEMDHSPTQIKTSNHTKTTTKNEKLPPIIITQKFANLNTFHKEMEQIIKGEYHINYSPGEIKLSINQREDYNAAVDNLKSNTIHSL